LAPNEPYLEGAVSKGNQVAVGRSNFMHAARNMHNYSWINRMFRLFKLKADGKLRNNTIKDFIGKFRLEAISTSSAFQYIKRAT
jgi:hypothetical protein